VATYRREPKVSGRPSYSNTYSVLNALAGHYNSFGATAPIPKKRLDRINKELDDATLYLSRGR
jgi:photosystem II Psb27 protein